MKKTRSIRFFAPLIAAVAVGCVAQKYEPCVQARVPIVFDVNPEHVDTIARSVETIDFYVFDETTRLLVAIIPVDKAAIERGFIDIAGLPDGTYTLVAWGDSEGDMSRSFEGVQMNDPATDDHSSVQVGETTLDNFYMLLSTSPAGGGVVRPVESDFDDLFFARVEHVRVSSGTSSTEPVKFVRNANTLKIHINGLDKVQMAKGQLQAKTRAGDDALPPLDVYVLAKNGRYDVNNQIDKDAQVVRYEPQYLDYNASDGGKSMTVYIKTMRIDLARHAVDPVLLYVRDRETGTEMISPVDILDALLQIKDPATGEMLYGSQAALDSAQEYIIEIDFEITNNKLSVSITIDGWRVEILEPVVRPAV